MKVICQKDLLLKAINSVINGVPSKTTMPILEGILIQTNDNELKLTTYDLDIGIEYVMECDIKEHGSIVVKGTMLGDFIRKLPDSDIVLTLNDNHMLELSCDGLLYKLATMNATEYPELPTIEIEDSIELEQNLLKTMIRKTVFATSTEKSKPVFTGTLFEVSEKRLNMVAVDGFRLALKNAYIENGDKEFKVIVPAKPLNELCKILEDSYSKVKMGVAKNQAVFEMANCKIVTRTLDGEFLNYRKVIPESWETRIKCSKALIQESFERISLITVSDTIKEKKYPVKMDIEIGKVNLTCVNQTQQGKEEIFVDTEGKNLVLAFNPKFVLDSLKAIDEEEIYMEFGTNLSPCLIKSVENNDFVYMVLPMKI